MKKEINMEKKMTELIDNLDAFLENNPSQEDRESVSKKLGKLIEKLENQVGEASASVVG